MGRKRKKEIKPFCYYCDRTFNDEATLILHQKSKHWRCSECYRKLQSSHSLSLHFVHEHSTKLTAVPFAKAGRDSIELNILGMVGVPEDAIEEHLKQQQQQQQEYDDNEDDIPNNNKKKSKIAVTSLSSSSTTSSSASTLSTASSSSPSSSSSLSTSNLSPSPSSSSPSSSASSSSSSSTSASSAPSSSASSSSAASLSTHSSTLASAVSASFSSLSSSAFAALNSYPPTSSSATANPPPIASPYGYPYQQQYYANAMTSAYAQHSPYNPYYTAFASHPYSAIAANPMYRPPIPFYPTFSTVAGQMPSHSMSTAAPQLPSPSSMQFPGSATSDASSQTTTAVDSTQSSAAAIASSTALSTSSTASSFNHPGKQEIFLYLDEEQSMEEKRAKRYN